jgi:1-acyl-sn-glycerol-3-phosphate acyltransferase
MLLGMPAHLLTRVWDKRRRVPQWFAITLWGRMMFWTNPLWRVHISGHEHLAGGGPFLVCCNHTSLIDSLVMLMIGHQVKFISHRKVFKAPLLGPYMHWCGYIPVDPANPFPAPEVARNIKHWWDLGESVCLYPEGTRSRDGEIQPFKRGGFRLATASRVTVVPVAIDGTYPILPKGRLTPLSGKVQHIHVRILPPITAQEYGDDPIGLSKRAHDAIAAALDEMRGRVAADDPGAIAAQPVEVEPTAAVTPHRVASA